MEPSTDGNYKRMNLKVKEGDYETSVVFSRVEISTFDNTDSK